jgi:cytochrome oxidase Cu insertion factor (SCO1/SenC/PrrC family)
VARISLAFLILCLVSSVSAVKYGNAARAQSRPKANSSVRRYSCPMHPEVTSSKPGKCPKCGMRLRLAPQTETNDDAARPIASPPATGDLPAISAAQIPDVRVYDQDGNSHNFYRDLVRDKTVAINFIFTTCTGVCPPMTATFRKVQENLSQRSSGIQLISISVDPTTDTPARLHEFAAKFKAGPGWTFVTGDKTDIDAILRALGVAVANKNDHTPMILVGNEPADYWTRVYGLSSPTIIAQTITDAESHQPKRK